MYYHLSYLQKYKIFSKEGRVLGSFSIKIWKIRRKTLLRVRKMVQRSSDLSFSFACYKQVHAYYAEFLIPDKKHIFFPPTNKVGSKTSWAKKWIYYQGNPRVKDKSWGGWTVKGKLWGCESVSGEVG